MYTLHAGACTCIVHVQCHVLQHSGIVHNIRILPMHSVCHLGGILHVHDVCLSISTFCCCRETEWLFSSDPGQRQLAESAGFERLVVVTLHRSHTYSSLDAVKEEVAGKAVELIQQGLPHGRQVHV